MRRLHYSWIIVAVGLVTLITSAGFRSTTGILIVPLQDEFGWSRATISFAIAINLVIYGLGGPFAAAFVERYGMRRVITVAVLGISVGAGLSTLMTAPWQLDVLWGVVNAAATGAISVPLGAMIANRWFARRRGLVTGLLTASNASGQLIFLPLLAWIVTQSRTSGSTTTSATAAAVPAA
jgi:MFS family permease